MAREIKFRAWDSVSKKMWTPDFISHDGFAGMSLGIKEHPSDLVYDTDRFPVMQFTGLKDKNGKEIYEGDIVARDYKPIPMIVRWGYASWVVKRADKTDPFLHDLEPGVIECCEVIGNIYENPELLKV